MTKIRPRSMRFRGHRPNQAEPRQSHQNGRPIIEPSGQRRKTVLVAEDPATFGGLIVGLLKQEGYNAFRAWNDREAAKMARDRRPDLVLVDLSLPYTEQVELVQALLEAEELAGRPLVVVSSHPVAFLKETPRVAEVVTKPFDVDKLMNAVRRALGEPEVEIPERQYTAQDYHLNAW